MYTSAKTVVRTVYGNSNCFEVKVSMHQDSASSPLLFVTVMEGFFREFRVALPWQLLYADLVLIAETEDELILLCVVKKNNDWVKKSIKYEVEGCRPRGRQKGLGKRLCKKTVTHTQTQPFHGPLGLCLGPPR